MKTAKYLIKISRLIPDTSCRDANSKFVPGNKAKKLEVEVPVARKPVFISAWTLSRTSYVSGKLSRIGLGLLRGIIVPRTKALTRRIKKPSFGGLRETTNPTVTAVTANAK
jgi:hypothetical protein